MDDAISFTNKIECKRLRDSQYGSLGIAFIIRYHILAAKHNLQINDYIQFLDSSIVPLDCTTGNVTTTFF